MKKVLRFFEIAWSIIMDVFATVFMWLEDNLRNIAKLLNILLPFLMLYIGQAVYQERGKFAVGGEILVPIFVGIIIYFFRSFANKIGKGMSIPTPSERFTEEDDDGEVTIPTSRIQELILYMNDLENWLEHRGLL